MEISGKSEADLRSELDQCKNTMEALRQSEALYRIIVETQSELICRFNKNGILNFVNESFCRYFNKSREDLIGSRFQPGVLEKDREQVKRGFQSLSIINPLITIEYRVRMPDGEVRWQQWNELALFDSQDNIIEYQAVGRDITGSKRLEEKLQYQGMHDALTDLYNRAYYDEEMLRMDTSRFLPLGIIVADIDGLKIINDTLGHQSGDELIRSAARLLNYCFRKSDVVARIGGDEFAIILPKASHKTLELSCHRIKKTVKDYRISHNVPLSLAVGFAIKNNPDENIQDILAQADNQMYMNKEKNRKSTYLMMSQMLNAAD